eukprot:symbB.v1.2.012139.t1/scaffold829.1/size159244/9
MFLKQEFAESAKNSDSHWFDQRKTAFNEALAKWNSNSEEIIGLKRQLSLEAKRINREANRERSSKRERYDAYVNDSNEKKRELHTQQCKLVDATCASGLLCPSNLDTGLPSSICPQALSDYAIGKNLHPIKGQFEDCEFADDGPGALPLVATTTESPKELVEHGIASGKIDSATVHHVFEHGPALFGLGDDKFGISEALLERACARQGFIQDSNRQFAMEHASMCDVGPSLGEDESMNLDNLRNCQNVYGRFCKQDIQNHNRYKGCVDMVQNIARCLALRRSTKFGNNFFLGPDTPFPILLIQSGLRAFGRLAIRACFKPLEIDWLHCSVTHEGEVFRLRPDYKTYSQARSVCMIPKVDSMQELAVWFSQLDGSWKFKLFWDYDVSSSDLSEIFLRSNHENMDVAETRDDGLHDLIPPIRGNAPVLGQEELEERRMLDSATSLLKVLKSTTKDNGQKTTGCEEPLLHATGDGQGHAEGNRVDDDDVESEWNAALQQRCSIPLGGQQNAQRLRYVEMKKANPDARIRSDTQLGPRVSVQVDQTERSTLEQPKSYFVDLVTFKQDFPDRKYEQSDLCWEHIGGKWVQGVNVLMGKPGYYKRKRGIEKAVTKRTTIHDGEAEISPDAADKMFSMSTQKVLPSSSDGLNIQDLPFFRAMNFPKRSAIADCPAAPIPLGDQPAAPHNDDAIPLQDKPMEEVKENESSDEDQTAGPSSFAYSNLASLFAKAKAAPASKAAAKEKAKAKVKTAPKASTSKGKKRNASGEAVVENLVSQTSTKNVSASAAAESGDQSLIDEHETKIKIARSKMFSEVGDSENVFLSALKMSHRELVGMNNAIKGKIKSLSRRKDKGGSTAERLEEFSSEFQTMISCTTSLMSLACEDTVLVDQVLELRSMGWKLADSLLKRALKATCLSQLKYSDWEGFNKATFDLALKHLGDNDGAEFFELMINEMSQKLLRALSNQKVQVSDEEQMGPLQGFMGSLMLNDFVVKRPISLTIEKFHVILCSPKRPPKTVSDAVLSFKETGSNEVHSDGGLRAVIMSIAQGKALVRQAEEIADKSQKEVKFLDGVVKANGDLDVFNSEFTEHRKVDETKCADIMIKSAKLIQENVSKAQSDAAREILEETRKSLSKAAEAFSHSYTVHQACPWFSASLSSFKSDAGVAPLPPMHTKELVDMLACKKSIWGDDALKMLESVSGLQSQMQGIHSTISSSKPDAAATVKVVRKFNDFLNEHAAFVTSFGDAVTNATRNMSELLESFGKTHMQGEADQHLDALTNLMVKAMFQQTKTADWVADPEKISKQDLASADKICQRMENLASAASDPDNRDKAKLLVKPSHVMQRILNKREIQEQKWTMSQVVDSIHRLLSTNIAFAAKFGSADAFGEIVEKIRVRKDQILEHRRTLYTKDMGHATKTVFAILDKLPAVSMDKLKDFIQGFSLYQKDLLSLSQKMEGLMLAVEKDGQEFLCEKETVCSSCNAPRTKKDAVTKPAAKKAAPKKTSRKKNPDNPFEGKPDADQGVISQFLKAKAADLSSGSGSKLSEPADKRQKLGHPEVVNTSFESNASVAQQNDPPALSSSGVSAKTDGIPTEIENTKGNTSEGVDAEADVSSKEIVTNQANTDVDDDAAASVTPKESGFMDGNITEGPAAKCDVEEIDQTKGITADADVTTKESGFMDCNTTGGPAEECDVKETDQTKGINGDADVETKESGFMDGDTTGGPAEECDVKETDQTKGITADADVEMNESGFMEGNTTEDSIAEGASNDFDKSKSKTAEEVRSEAADFALEEIDRNKGNIGSVKTAEVAKSEGCSKTKILTAAATAAGVSADQDISLSSVYAFWQNRAQENRELLDSDMDIWISTLSATVFECLRKQCCAHPKCKDYVAETACLADKGWVLLNDSSLPEEHFKDFIVWLIDENDKATTDNQEPKEDLSPTTHQTSMTKACPVEKSLGNPRGQKLFGEPSFYVESSSFKTLAGNLDVLKTSCPLWAILENVDLGDSSDDDSNGAMLKGAMLDVGYCTRSLSWPIKIPPHLRDNPWFQVLPPREQEDLVVALSIFVHVVGDGAMVLCMALNQLKEGLFERFLMEVWLPGTYRIQLLQRRKICIFGLIRVMQLPQMPEKAFEACCQALLRLLRLRQAGHPILIFEELFNNRPLFLCKKAEGINPGEEFQVAYNHLEQAELKEDIWDVLPEIQDVACAKVAVKAALAPLQQALSKVEGAAAQHDTYTQAKEYFAVKIPSNVTSISESAFENSLQLVLLTISESVTHIGDCAFAGCTSLASMTMGESVTHIGNSAFARCTSLASIALGESVTHIGNSAFARCTSLASIALGES